MPFPLLLVILSISYQSFYKLPVFYSLYPTSYDIQRNILSFLQCCAPEADAIYEKRFYKFRISNIVVRNATMNLSIMENWKRVFPSAVGNARNLLRKDIIIFEVASLVKGFTRQPTWLGSIPQPHQPNEKRINEERSIMERAREEAVIETKEWKHESCATRIADHEEKETKAEIPWTDGQV